MVGKKVGRKEKKLVGKKGGGEISCWGKKWWGKKCLGGGKKFWGVGKKSWWKKVLEKKGGEKRW